MQTKQQKSPQLKQPSEKVDETHCPNHKKERFSFFCETDSTNICNQCVPNH